MILKNLHTENKPVQKQLLFEPKDAKVISLQIAKGETLKEHVSKIPALLVCISGNAVFTDDKGTVVNLNSGTYVMIEENVKHAVKAFDESNFLLMK
jgi:quercetin dioxygenase-like cupin family protein